jgi:hypothetical protein
VRQETEPRSALLKHIRARMPDLTERLAFFADSFDPAQVCVGV